MRPSQLTRDPTLLLAFEEMEIFPSAAKKGNKLAQQALSFRAYTGPANSSAVLAFLIRRFTTT